MRFSDEQLSVINTEGCNILVSAAAGSGKTAVLVERIIRKITDVTKPINIDSLLVMTFTRAAAAEMKERIEAAVNKRLLVEIEKGEDTDLISHLKQQASLVRIASITTIDSFCKDVIQNNFSKIGLDPSFRIANEAELKLLRVDVMQQLMESLYEDADEEFLDFLQNFSVKSSDRDVEECIEKLYDYAQSKPNPYSYLKNCIHNYTYESADALFGSELIRDYLDGIRQLILDFAEESLADVRICEKPSGPYKYADVLQKDADTFRKIAAIGDYEELQLAIEGIAFDRMPSISKNDLVDEDLKKLVTKKRDERKRKVKEIFNKSLPKKKNQIYDDICGCSSVVKELSQLAILFMEKFEDKKRELSILDFSDLEHLALAILYEEDMITPSDIAVSYKNRFNEIMVDEYQDSNEVQEALVNAICRENNVFTVGDVKQSIYGFRLTKPELFLNRLNSFEKINDNLTNSHATNSVRIDLHKNYRSAASVLDSTNYVFDKIMHKSVGGIEYDQDARLVHSRENPDCKDSFTELLLIENNPEADNVELEAIAIAQRIIELMDSFEFADKDSGELRKLKYRDIAILIRSRRGYEDVFSKVLSEHGIPNHAESSVGFFSGYEIRNVINYLKIVNNPLDDETLVSVLRSPFGQFLDEELAIIRTGYKMGCFYEALQAFCDYFDSDGSLTPENADDGLMRLNRFKEAFYEDNESNRALHRKVVDFYSKLEYYHEISIYTPVYELIDKIIEDFDYESFIASMNNNESRLMNLSALLVRAKEFEASSFKGLLGFIHYIEKLRIYEIEYGEAETISEYDDCVKIMSIHKSKGLEFPVTFLSAMGKVHNINADKSPIVLDEIEGIGIDYIDSLMRTKATTIIKEAIKFKQKRDNIGEELRILYVGMTRAREKLIMTGVVSDEILLLYENGADNQKLSMTGVLKENSFLKLVLAATYNPNSKKFENPKINIRRYTNEEMLANEEKYADRDKDALIKVVNNYSENGQNNEDFVYPYSLDSDIPMKLSVSAIKHMSMEEKASMDGYDLKFVEEDDVDKKIPYFISGDSRMELVGALRGSAYHRIFELLPFDGKGLHKLSDLKDEFVKKGLISKEEAQAVKEVDIDRFMSTKLYQRMCKANEVRRLFKEQPFSYLVSADTVNDAYPVSEEIIIQGIIDAFFYEGDEIVIMDYKTDRVKTGKELIERYDTQLKLYANALNQITGKRVAECIIYSVELGEEITLDMQ